MSRKISCRSCNNFIPDTVGDGYGIGQCLVYNAYRDKNPSERALRLARIKLGNHPDLDIFWGGTLEDRICEKYEAEQCEKILNKSTAKL